MHTNCVCSWICVFIYNSVSVAGSVSVSAQAATMLAFDVYGFYAEISSHHVVLVMEMWYVVFIYTVFEMLLI